MNLRINRIISISSLPTGEIEIHLGWETDRGKDEGFFQLEKSSRGWKVIGGDWDCESPWRGDPSHEEMIIYFLESHSERILEMIGRKS